MSDDLEPSRSGGYVAVPITAIVAATVMFVAWVLAAPYNALVKPPPLWGARGLPAQSATCGADPLTGGSDGFGGCFPGSSNTGYPEASLGSMTTCGLSPDGDGNYRITVPGTYNLCHWPSGVGIYTSGVTITNSFIDGGGMGAPADNLQGAVIQDSTIDCDCQSVGPSDTPSIITYDNFTLRRVEVTNGGHGANIGSNITIEDTWIHGLGGDTDAHKDGLFIGGGSNGLIRHNSVECNDGTVHFGCTASVFFSGDFSQASGWVVNNNLLNTNGPFCFYGNGGGSKPFSSDNITFTNNHFGSKFNATCGSLGPVANWDAGAGGMVWSGNVWHDTGATVNPS